MIYSCKSRNDVRRWIVLFSGESYYTTIYIYNILCNLEIGVGSIVVYGRAAPLGPPAYVGNKYSQFPVGQPEEYETRIPPGLPCL